MVLFDPKTIVDRATYKSPRLASSGVRSGIVGGIVLIDQGKPVAFVQCQFLESLQRELGAVIDGDRHRRAVLGNVPFQRPGDDLAGQRKTNHHRRHRSTTVSIRNGLPLIS